MLADGAGAVGYLLKDRVLNGDQFAVRFHFDVTVKETGERRVMDEVGLYTVRNGKIVEERFFY